MIGSTFAAERSAFALLEATPPVVTLGNSPTGASQYLNEGEAEQGSSIVLASMLLYAVLLRYQISVEPSYDAWYQNRVQDRFADLSVTGVLGTLRSEYGDGWWRCPNREILNVSERSPSPRQ